MVPDFVRDHIGRRRIAGRAEASAQILEEAQIEIEPTVARAVGRPDRRLRKAARRLHGAAEQYEPRLLVRLVRPAERPAPGFLGVGQHHGDELLALVRRPLDLARRRRVAHW